MDGSPPGSPIPGILQARTLEWVAISFSNAWKWKVKVKSLSRARLLATPWTAAYQAPPPLGFSRQEYWSGVPLPSLIQKITYLHFIKVFFFFLRFLPCSFVCNLSLSLHILPDSLSLFFMLLSEIPTSPSLEGVVLCRRWLVGPRSATPLSKQCQELKRHPLGGLHMPSATAQVGELWSCSGTGWVDHTLWS